MHTTSTDPRPIACVGGVLWESNFRIDRIPGEGVKVLPGDARQLASGMAPAAAAAIARLGHPAALWSLVGEDASGQACRQALAAEGVDTRGVAAVPGAQTPFSTILVDARGERMVVPFFDPRLFERAPPLPPAAVAGCAAVLVDVRWAAGAEAAMRQARALGVPALLDADLAPVDLLERLLPLADHVLCSEVALAALQPGQPPAQALRALARRLPQADVVAVTLGARGALAWEREAPQALLDVPAPAITAVDTLNAGDVWHGAYAFGLARGMAAAGRIELANWAAAIKCERPWGRLGAPTLAEVQARRAAGPEPLRPPCPD